MTYGSICTAGSHTANDGASQDKHCTKSVQHHNAQQTALDYPHIITVLNFKVKCVAESKWSHNFTAAQFFWIITQVFYQGGAIVRRMRFWETPHLPLP